MPAPRRRVPPRPIKINAIGGLEFEFEGISVGVKSIVLPKTTPGETFLIEVEVIFLTGVVVGFIVDVGTGIFDDLVVGTGVLVGLGVGVDVGGGFGS